MTNDAPACVSELFCGNQPLSFEIFPPRGDLTEVEARRVAGELAELEAALKENAASMSACGSDYVRLQELTQRQDELNARLEERTERWMYLNELKERIDAQS